MDDLTHAIAVIILIPYQSIGTMIYPVSIQLEAYGAQTSVASIAAFERLFHLTFAGQFLFWIILYAVKFTFLIFFRQIFGVNRVFMRWWWALFVYTWLAFIASFLTALWVCGDPSDLFVLGKHTDSMLFNVTADRLPEKCLAPHTSRMINNYAEVAFSLNVSSDLASKCLGSREVYCRLTNASHYSPRLLLTRPANAARQEDRRRMSVLRGNAYRLDRSSSTWHWRYQRTPKAGHGLQRPGTFHRDHSRMSANLQIRASFPRRIQYPPQNEKFSAPLWKIVSRETPPHRKVSQ